MMERNVMWIVIVWLIVLGVGVGLSEYGDHKKAIACIDKGMEWSSSYGGTCKAVEKK